MRTPASPAAEDALATAQPFGDQLAPRPFVKRLLLILPTLAAMGSFISLAPGSSGTINGYRIVVGLAFMPAIVALLRSPRKGPATRWLALTSVAFATWGVYSLTWAPSPGLGRRQLIGILLAVMGAWVAIGLTSTNRELVGALRRGFVFAAAVLTAIGLWQFTTGMNLWTLSGQALRFESTMLIGPFVNPNNFAAFLLGCSGPVISWTLTHRGLPRLVGLALLISMAFVILGTTSRAGLIALLVIMTCVMVFTMGRAPKLQVPIAFTIATLALMGWMLARQQITSGLSTAFSGNSGQSDSLRVSLSETAIRYFWESGGIGVGPGGFQEKLASESSQQVVATHNTFLQIAAEYGLPVFIPCMILILTLMTATLQRSNASVGVDPDKIELIAGFIAMLVGALVASSLIADPSWWLLIGYLVVLTRNRAQPVHPRTRSSVGEALSLR